MVGKMINYLLQENENLLALVPSENIFPYVINEKTPLPAVVYAIDALTVEYDKDLPVVMDTFKFTVKAYSENYGSLQDIAYQIRQAIELKSGIITGFSADRIELEGQDEGFELTESVYFNALRFTVNIKSYNN